MSKFPNLEETRKKLRSNGTVPKCPHCKRPMEQCNVYSCEKNPNRFDPKEWENHLFGQIYKFGESKKSHD